VCCVLETRFMRGQIVGRAREISSIMMVMMKEKKISSSSPSSLVSYNKPENEPGTRKKKR
jgi:hypothetical protein